MRTLKEALKRGLVLQKVHTVIKYNHKTWLKSYIDRNTELRKEVKKTNENVTKYRDINFVTT